MYPSSIVLDCFACLIEWVNGQTQGAAWKLKVDALVINMNESLTDRHGMNKEIFELGGPEVGKQLNRGWRDGVLLLCLIGGVRLIDCQVDRSIHQFACLSPPPCLYTGTIRLPEPWSMSDRCCSDHACRQLDQSLHLSTYPSSYLMTYLSTYRSIAMLSYHTRRVPKIQ